MDDFQRLITEVHNRKMTIMMDVVYNHTSKDSVLLNEHPEYFYRNKSGELSGKVGDWSDVTDLDYSVGASLWEELTETLVEYAKIGVDGFRCDVASLVPLNFWKFARQRVNKVNRKVVWLSESVHGGFTKWIRDAGFNCASEAEIYQVFDMAYDYDIQPYYENYLLGKAPLKDLLEGIKRQDEIYPDNYIKMKNLENHDCDRIAKYVGLDSDKIRNWTAFNFFQKGASMIYAGEEYSATIKPSLFAKELYDKNEDISQLIKKLAIMKKKSLFAKGVFNFYIPNIDGVAYNTVENDIEKYHGIFNVGLSEGVIEVDIADGNYRNYLNGKIIKVRNKTIELINDPIIIRLKK